MAKRPLPSPETLRQLLRYEPETGKLFWRPRGPEWFRAEGYHERWNKRFAHQEAFITAHESGYLMGSIFGVRYLAHRVIWSIIHDEEPPEEIDHENLVKSDNRASNLRSADKSTNQRNIRKRANNTSGFKGVSRSKSRGKPWRACIKVNGQFHHLGCFATPEVAAVAYREAAKRLHGRFARSE